MNMRKRVLATGYWDKEAKCIRWVIALRPDMEVAS